VMIFKILRYKFGTQAIFISVRQKGQSGAATFVSIHFIMQASWKMCLQGVSRTIVLD